MGKYTAGTGLLALAVIGLALGCEQRNPLATTMAAARTAKQGLSLSDDAEEGPTDCSVAGLQGSYGLLRQGTTTAGPLGAVGLISYDGNGNWVSTQSTSRSGSYSFDVATSGTYTVNADCTGKYFSADQEIGRLMIVDHGKTVFQLDETPQNQVTVTQKQVPHDCSAATLDGDYGFWRSGITSTGPLVSLGRAHYDGTGTGSAVQTNIRNGVINPDQVLDPTPYEINADCSGKLFFRGSEIARVVVVDKGREIYILSESAGNTVVGVQRPAAND